MFLHARTERAFEAYARTLEKFYLVFIFVPLLVTAALSVGFAFIDQRRAPRTDLLFIPENGRYQAEVREIRKIWKFNPSRFHFAELFLTDKFIELLAVADSENVLQSDLIYSLAQFNAKLQNVEVEISQNLSVDFKTMCLKLCGRCYGHDHLTTLNATITQLASLTELTYPIANRGKKPEYIGHVFGQVGLGHGNRLSSAKAMRLQYFLSDENVLVKRVSEQLMDKMMDFIDGYTIEGVEIYAASSLALHKNLRSTGDLLLTKISGLIVVMVIFVWLSSFRLFKHKGRRLIDWFNSQPLQALAGLLTAGMGCASGCGFVLLTGLTDFDSIVLIAPFLILCIGAISSVPAVRIFCASTALSIVFVYVYQVTFFAALLVLVREREERRMHCHGWWTVLEPEEAKDKSSWQLYFNSGRIQTSNVTKSVNLGDEFLRKHYVNIVFNPVILLMTFLWYAFYLGVSLYGLLHLEEGLDLTKMLTKGSDVSEWHMQTQKYIWPYGEACAIYILNPPNFTDPIERQNFEDFVDRLAGTYHTLPRDGLLLWYDSYMGYLKDIGFTDENMNDPSIWTDRLCYWAKEDRGRDAFSTHFRWENEGKPYADSLLQPCGEMLSFRMIFGLRNFVTPNDHRDTAALVRRIAASEPQYRAYSYNYYWQFADQYALIKPNTTQNVLIALFVMIIVSVLFIPNPLSSAVIAAAIVSIDLGVVGCMHFWDVHLDAISMITIIMSIGFSVDLSAHVCHAFMTAEGSPEDRAVCALSDVGIPVLQGALSSILGVSVLANIESYIVKVFYKIVILNMLFGLLHALLFLPIVLVAGCKAASWIRRKTRGGIQLKF